MKSGFLPAQYIVLFVVHFPNNLVHRWFKIKDKKTKNKNKNKPQKQTKKSPWGTNAHPNHYSRMRLTISMFPIYSMAVNDENFLFSS
jgi:hypothetical protein